MRKLSFWAASALVAAATLALAWSGGWWRHDASPLPAGLPKLRCVEAVDNGLADQGETVIARFTLHNEGDAALRIFDVRTTCICAGLETEEPDGHRRIESLLLQPGEKRHAVLRYVARGLGTEEVHNHALLRTNDPAAPEVRLRASVKIRGGLSAVPRGLAFGQVPVGTKRSLRLRLLDQHDVPRRVAAVASSDSKALTVHFVPATADAARTTTPQGEPAQFLGEVEAVFQAEGAGSFNGTIRIFLEGEEKPQDPIVVTGMGMPLMEFSPATLVVRPSAKAGQPARAEIECFLHHGSATALKVAQAPPNFQVKTTETGNPQRPYRVEVTVAEAEAVAASVERGVIAFEAIVDGKPHRFELPILHLRAEGR